MRRLTDIAGSRFAVHKMSQFLHRRQIQWNRFNQVDIFGQTDEAAESRKCKPWDGGEGSEVQLLKHLAQEYHRLRKDEQDEDAEAAEYVPRPGRPRKGERRPGARRDSDQSWEVLKELAKVIRGANNGFDNHFHALMAMATKMWCKAQSTGETLDAPMTVEALESYIKNETGADASEIRELMAEAAAEVKGDAQPTVD